MAGPDKPLLVDISPAEITGVVLAGGRGKRMGGADKGLQLLDGMPLAQHALRRLQAQVGKLMLNANRNLLRYQAMGVPVWPDALPDHAGPLAGFATALAHCTTPYLVTVPCDTPLFPHDLVARLARALQLAGADIATASTAGPDALGAPVWRAEPVFCLLRTELRANLLRFMAEGGRKVEAWTALHHTVLVRFDSAAAFANANTPAELLALQAGPARPGAGAYSAL